MAEVAPMDAELYAKIMKAWHGEDEVASMALPASGQIDMGQIRTEVNGSGQVSLNDADFRALINKSSGQQQAMSDYYGKSSAPPEVFIWQSGGASASCAGIKRGMANPGHEQYTGYMTNGGSSRITVDHSGGGGAGVYLWGNTQYAYSQWNGSGSEYPGGNRAYYSGRFDENGGTNGGSGRFPITLPSSWNGTTLDASKYGLQFKWHIYNIEKVMGYGWSWRTQGPGGGKQVPSYEISQNGWNTITINAANATAGYYEGYGSTSYARGNYNMHLIHIKMVPEKTNSYTCASGQSRLEEVLTAEEYRRYQIWMGEDPDALEPEPAMTPEEWLAANPGKKLVDPDERPEA